MTKLNTPHQYEIFFINIHNKLHIYHLSIDYQEIDRQ